MAINQVFMEEGNSRQVLRTGFFSSVFLFIVTLVTFGLAMTAVPKSGPFCTGNCIEYPYTDSLDFYPGDYFWMYLAVIQLTVWLVFMISVHYNYLKNKSIFGTTAVVFASLSVVILFLDYFIQFSVVPVSLMKGETEGIALLTQYNDHGIFIAMEEAGYIMMSVAFMFMALAVNAGSKAERWLKRIFLMPFILSVILFAWFSIKFGTDRSYRFEIWVITVNWLAMLAGSILAGLLFYRQLRKISFYQNS